MTARQDPSGPLRGLRRRESFTITVLDVCRFDGGKIVEHWGVPVGSRSCSSSHLPSPRPPARDRYSNSAARRKVISQGDVGSFAFSVARVLGDPGAGASTSSRPPLVSFCSWMGTMETGLSPFRSDRSICRDPRADDPALGGDVAHPQRPVSLRGLFSLSLPFRTR